MRSDNYLWNRVVLPIYIEMYEKAEPSLDFAELYDSLMKGEKKLDDNWFMNYYLQQDIQLEIISKHCKKCKCTKRETERVKTTIFFGCAPSVNNDNSDNSENSNSKL